MTVTFYLLNFAITCYVIPDVIRYCVVCKRVFQRQR